MENEPGPSFSGLKTMQLNDQKAGMEGLDKEAINKIIYENSKGTPYFAHQEKRQKSIDSKVNELQEVMKKITESERKKSLEKMDLLCVQLESQRDLSHSIVHIDMDAFYAAVEMRDHPDLKDKPIAVGSSSMLSTSNYHARKYGVRAAMPGFIAKKLCPELIIVPYNFEKYKAVSKKMCRIVEDYDPDYSSSSLDEVYLDLTEYIWNKFKRKQHEDNCLKNDACDNFSDDQDNKGHHNTVSSYLTCLNCTTVLSNELRDEMAYEIVNEIRQRIYDTTQLTASAGIAPNSMLAKVCSDQNKPNGQYQIKSNIEAVKSFISNLPVKKISGIGPVQGQILNSIDIQTCADLWSKRDLVDILFSSISTEFYMEVALGIGSTTVKSHYTRKSIGNERTFREIHEPVELHRRCEELCDDLIEDLKPHNMLGKVIVLKFKTTDFETHTRNHSLKYYTDDSEIIKSAAKKLLDAEIAAAAPRSLKLRLMGVRMCNLLPADSVSSSEKQPTTLKNFFISKLVRESSSGLNCPVLSDKGEPNPQDLINDCSTVDTVYPTSDIKNSDDLIYSVPQGNDPTECISIQFFPPQNEVDFVKYYCPVCYDPLPTCRDLTDLNTHVDKCLNKGTIKEILASKEGEPNLQDLINDSSPLDTVYPPSDIKDSYDLICSGLQGNDSTESSFIQSFPHPNEDDFVEYYCPVCNDPLPTCRDLTDLNTHVDKCLNKGTIKEILAGDLPVISKRKKVDSQKSSKRKKGSEKEKKIEDYFTNPFCKLPL